MDAVLPRPLRRLAAARTRQPRLPPSPPDSAGPRGDAGRRRLAGDHPLAGREDGLDRGRQGDRQARQPGGFLPSARARDDRAAHPRYRPGRHRRRRRPDHGARVPGSVGERPGPGQGRRARPGPAAASRHRSLGHRRDRRPHRPAARHQADGDQADRGAARAGKPDLPRGRPQGASLHHQFRLLLRRPPRGAGGLPHRGGPPVVGAADRRGDHRLRHQLGGAVDDLRAGRADGRSAR